MDDNDLEQLVERIKLTGVVPVQGENGATVDSRTVEIPYQASKEAIAEIKASLYEDFMCFNVELISSGSKTATEIEASYQNLEMKASELEYCVIDFINKILRLAKIDDKPSFTRSKIANTQQELDMVLASAEYLDDETITTKICNILGMGDQAEEILQKVQAEEVKRLEPTKGGGDGE
jgi:transcriptional regulator of heat shock response